MGLDMKRVPIFTILLVFSILQVIPVFAPQPDYDISLGPRQDYCIPGDTVQIDVRGNASTSYNLTIYDPHGQVIHTAQRSTGPDGSDFVNLPTQQNQEPGTYRITGLMGTTLCTTHISILNVTGWQSTTFPFQRSHMGIDFTIGAKGFMAVSDSGTISINYPNLPISFTVNAFQNSMGLVERLRNDALDIRIDLSYFFMHKGMKIIINGSVPTARTYTFRFTSPRIIISKLDTVRDGFLVFDWSDMRNMGQAFSYDHNTGMLTVTIPQSFRIDPYVFEDGFEGADGDWTTVVDAGFGWVDMNCTTTVHHGSESANCTINGPSGHNEAYIYTTLASSYSEAWLTTYMNFTDLPDGDGEYIGIGGFDNQTNGWLTGFYVRHDTGAVRWRCVLRSDATIGVTNTTLTVSTNTWYCIEHHYKLETGSNNGFAELWIDGNLVANCTDANNGAFGEVDKIDLGSINCQDSSCFPSIFIDCVYFDITQIGQEASNTTPTVGSISNNPSRIEENINFQLSCTVNDADGIADFANCTLTLDDDWGHNFSLKWVASTNVFSEGTDTSNFCTLQSGTRTTVNSTAYTLAWTLLIRESFPEQPLDVVASVFDSNGANGISTSNNLFIFHHKPDSQISLPPITTSDDSDQNGTEGTEDTVGVGDSGGPPSTITISPIVVGAGLVILIVGVTAYSQAPTLKNARKNWKKKDKEKRSNWKKGKPFT